MPTTTALPYPPVAGTGGGTGASVFAADLDEEATLGGGQSRTATGYFLDRAVSSVGLLDLNLPAADFATTARSDPWQSHDDGPSPSSHEGVAHDDLASSLRQNDDATDDLRSHGGASCRHGVFDLPPILSSTHDSAAQIAACMMVKGANGVCRWVTLKTAMEVGLDEDDNDDDEATMRGALAAALGDGPSWRLAVRRGLEDEPQPQRADLVPVSPSPVSTLRDGRDDACSDGLWASMYSPNSVAELLSDEEVNLGVLQWLAEWKRHVAIETKAGASVANNKRDVAARTAGPPSERIALLVGPPGVGKTTLAHVAARHMGFEPVEINASVQRSAGELAAVLRQVVANNITTAADLVRSAEAHTSRSAPPSRSFALREAARRQLAERGDSTRGLLGPAPEQTHRRPLCLILDEIDGCAENLTALILKLNIQRPVFCLANNLYSPALRELRVSPLVAVWALKPIAVSQLVARLTAITSREGFANVDRSILFELAELSNGDVRTSLNTLQFLCRSLPRPAKAVTPLAPSLATVSSAQVSVDMSRLLKHMKEKDTGLNLWQLWALMFERLERSKYLQLQSASTSSRTTGGTKEGDAAGGRIHGPLTRLDPGFDYIMSQLGHQAAVSLGSLDTSGPFIAGLFEQFPFQRFSDYDFRKTASLSELFAWNEIISSKSFRAPLLQSCGVKEACLAAAGRCYYTTASLAKASRKLAYPNQQQQQEQRRQQILAELQAFGNAVAVSPGASPWSLAAFLSTTTLATAEDIAPMFIHASFPKGVKIVNGISYAPPSRQQHGRQQATDSNRHPTQRKMATDGAPLINAFFERPLQSVAERLCIYGCTLRDKKATAGGKRPSADAELQLGDKRSRSDNDAAKDPSHASNGGRDDDERDEDDVALEPALDKLLGWNRGAAAKAAAVTAAAATMSAPVETSKPSWKKGFRTGGGRSWAGAGSSAPEDATSRDASKEPFVGGRWTFPTPWQIIPVRRQLAGEVTAWMLRRRMDLARRATERVASKPATAAVARDVTAVAETKRAPSPAVTAPTVPQVPMLRVRRDFFGRPLKTEDAAEASSELVKDVRHRAPSSDSTVGGPRLPSAARGQGAASIVRYGYFDGATNGIRRPATIDDFL